MEREEGVSKDKMREETDETEMDKEEGLSKDKMMEKTEIDREESKLLSTDKTMKVAYENVCCYKF